MRAYNWANKTRVPLAWGIVLFCLLLQLSIPIFVAASEPVRARTISLFNGTNLAGFHTWLVDAKRDDPRRVFSVTNGQIRISGEGLGYLATDREYRNYRLVAEFKWGKINWPWGDRVGAARDSGIFLNATGPDGNSFDGRGAFQSAIECNIMQGAVGDFLLIRGTNFDGSPISPRITAEVAPERDTDNWFFWQAGGKSQTIKTWGRLNWFGKDRHWRDVTGFRGPRDVESPEDEWTRVECVCTNATITIRVNGKMVNRAVDVSPDHGRILLQCEGSEIFFRKLELTFEE